MEFEFEYEEKENFTSEEVQAILEGFKTKVGETIKAKDEEVLGLTTQVEKVKELEEGNHLLQIKNLAITNNISDDLFDLIVDPDIEVVKTKIDKLKSITKEQKIENSYKPEKKKTDDAYARAENNKDVKGMLSQKINKIFG